MLSLRTVGSRTLAAFGARIEREMDRAALKKKQPEPVVSQSLRERGILRRDSIMTKDVWVVLQKELEQDQESAQEETDCAWCLRDAGEEMGEGSHGICTEHAEKEYQEWRSRRNGAA